MHMEPHLSIASKADGEPMALCIEGRNSLQGYAFHPIETVVLATKCFVIVISRA